MEKGTLVLTRSDIQNALSLAEYLPVIEEAHALHAQGKVYAPDLLHADVRNREFHLKTGGICYGDEEYYGVKINGGFPGNMENYGLPSILGIIYICDARNGSPIAIMDSVTISKWRTGAATAVAAKYLAPEGRVQLGVFGYGTQAEIQAKALSLVRPIEIIRVSGRNVRKAESFSVRLQKELGIPVICCSGEEAARCSNLIVTATPARKYYIRKEWIQPGCFIAAIGADSPGKQELDPRLVASSVVVTDIKVQACRVGESQHAISQGLMGKESIYAELGEIVTGRKMCPASPESIIIYDSTGTALQDISVGVAIVKKLKSKHCNRICF